MLKRLDNNPILEPVPENPWESKLVFNPAAILLEKKVHLLYRASDMNDISTLGYAVSEDGISIDYRSDSPVFEPESEKDMLGVEDPRLVRIDDRIFMTYTAYGKIPEMDRFYPRIRNRIPQIGVTSISVDDFLRRKWNFSRRIYPLPEVRDKNCVILPEKINGEYLIFHRVRPHIWSCRSENLHEWKDHNIFMSPEYEWESFKIGAGAPPVKTEKGWLFIYHGVDTDLIYRLGFAFLEQDNPVRIIYRHPEPIFSPEKDFEEKGEVSNVVFTCGTVLKDDRILVYYGGADKVIGVAQAPLSSFYEAAGF